MFEVTDTKSRNEVVFASASFTDALRKRDRLNEDSASDWVDTPGRYPRFIVGKVAR